MSNRKYKENVIWKKKVWFKGKKKSEKGSLDAFQNQI